LDDVVAGDAVAELRELVDMLVHPEKYEQFGIGVTRGVLLFGPPGTGKKMLARGLATEAGVRFYSTDGPSLTSMWTGESAMKIRQLFEQARGPTRGAQRKKGSKEPELGPAIIFIDEIGKPSVGGGGLSLSGCARKSSHVSPSFLLFVPPPLSPNRRARLVRVARVAPGPEDMNGAQPERTTRCSRSCSRVWTVRSRPESA
jgi:hypothetical protein